MIKNEKISITEVDLNLKITFCSGILKSLQNLFNKEQVIGSSPLDFETTQDRKAYLIKKTNHLKKTGEYFTDIAKFQHNNIIITIQHQWFPVYEADNITSYAIISSDITEQVQLETDKRNSEKALEEALSNKNRRRKTLKSILTNMSHELRTPLNAIMGMFNCKVKIP